MVSRSTLFRLEPLSEEDIVDVLRRAISDKDRGYGALNLTVDDDALKDYLRESHRLVALKLTKQARSELGLAAS